MGTVRQLPNASLRDFKARLQRMPVEVATEIARQAAPILTAMARASWDRGDNVYGDARPPGVDGNPLSLVATGDTKRTLSFKANGRIIRAELGPKYAKYLIGKYKILPIGDRTAMPLAWRRALDELAREIISNPARVAA